MTQAQELNVVWPRQKGRKVGCVGACDRIDCLPAKNIVFNFIQVLKKTQTTMRKWMKVVCVCKYVCM